MALLKAAAIASVVSFAHALNCMDYSALNQGEVGVGPGKTDDSCWLHMKWAMDVGLHKKKDWYPPGTTSTPADTQCALYLMTIGANGPPQDGHACNKAPCNDISTSMADGGKSSTVGNPNTCAPKDAAPSRSEAVVPALLITTTEAPAEGPSMEWWAWLLLIAGILGLCAVAAFFLMKKPAPKTKRAVRPVEPKAPEPEPVMTTVREVPTYYQIAQPAQQSFIMEMAPPVVTSVVQGPPVMAPPVMAAPPVYEVLQAPPMVQSFAAPQMVQSVVAAPQPVMAPPVYAAPQFSTGPAPITYAAPVSTIAAAPMTYAAPVSTIGTGSVTMPMQPMPVQAMPVQAYPGTTMYMA